MTTRMLIDARHREETRVAVVKGNRIEEFDFESAEHKQLKGNIYLAKVTRVEPSLQAAFVDYGGNRHGFLAFSEIHPDYYQIPKEDRDALLAEEAEHAAEEERLREAEGDYEPINGHHDDDGQDHDRPDADMERAELERSDLERADFEAVTIDGEFEDITDGDDDAAPQPESVSGDNGHDDAVSHVQAASALRAKRMALRRRYKIQDVIRRRQVLLVQVVKEERGNKGAALTTYLSLAGRYCVLMPNTSHGGGISRKISNGADRKRLKSIVAEMNLPPSMGCIVRTAGLQRTKTEIKRDFDYLARLWDEIRDKTLRASAPAPIHTDSDLIKRAIRDIYNRDIEEVLVEGEDGYRAAKDFMKLLMPSHARRVQNYADPVSLFQRYGVEDQLAAMYNPVVQLKSGGYLVINPTEALVSIDINSGRSTREHGIEQTAVATNLEAAREIARQLRLRDMAGLVVIDFIDMESNSNIRKVEKAIKEALKNDRARIQVGRISGFGLMEMSRQRLRTGVLEASTRACPHCEGTGLVRTASSAALSALRMLEEEAARGRATKLVLRASTEASFYVLNNKRAELAEIEDRYGVTVEILPDGETEGARMALDASGPPPANAPKFIPVIDEDDDFDFIDEEDDDDARDGRDDERGDNEGGRKRKRRRRRRGGRERDRDDSVQHDAETGDEADSDAGDGDAVDSDGNEAQDARADQGDEEGRKRRRGRRGGRRRRGREGEAREGGEAGADEAGEAAVADADGDADAVTANAEAPVAEAPTEEEAAPKKTTRRRPRARKDADESVAETAPAEAAPEEAPAKPKRASRAKKASEPVAAEAAETPAEKPKRASRARKPKAETAVKDAAETAETAEAAPKAPNAKAPARRTRKAAAPKETATDTATDAATDAPEAPAKPARAKAAPKRTPRAKKEAVTEAAPVEAAPAETAPAAATPAAAPETAPAAEPADPAGDNTPRKTGWWQRTFG